MISVEHFPAGPRRALRELLPGLARVEGVRPWRPHRVVRALCSGLPQSEEVVVRVLIHVLLEVQPETRGAWESVFSSEGRSLCLIRRPTKEEFSAAWARPIDPPFSLKWETSRLLNSRDPVGTKHSRFWEACRSAQLARDER